MQVSASNGQTVLHPGGEADPKYVVIQTIPDSALLPEFLFFYIRETIDERLELIRTGINIQVEEIENYWIEF